VVDALEDLATSISSVDSALAKFDSTKLDKLAESKKWTALSRLVSGILPGFWSFQNKIRGFVDILYMLEKRQEKQLKAQLEAAKQFKVIDENYEKGMKLKKQLIMLEEDRGDIIKEISKLEAMRTDTTELTKDQQKRLEYLKETAQMHEQINEKAEKLNLTTEDAIRLTKLEYKASLQKAELDFEKTGGALGRQLEARKKLNRAGNLKTRIFGSKESRKLQRQILKKKIVSKIDGMWKGIKTIAKAAASFLMAVLVISIAAFFLQKWLTKSGADILVQFRALKTTLTEAFTNLKERFSSLMINAEKLYGFFKEGDFWNFLISLGAVIFDLLKIIWGVIKIALIAIGGSIWAIIKGTFDSYVKSFESKTSAVFATIVTIAQVIAAIFLIIGIIASFAWVPMLIAGIVLALTAAIQALVPGFASGGVSSGGLAVVGEKGPELVNLPRGSRVHSNAESRQMAGTNTINVYVQGRVGASDQEIRELAKKVGEEISRNISRFTASGVFNRG